MPVELKESPIQKATASGIFLPPSVEEFNAAAPVPDLAEFQAAAPVTPAAPTLDEFQAAPRAVHIPSMGPSTAEFSQAPQNPDIGKLMERTPQELAADDAFSPVAMLGQYGKDLPPDLREKLYEIYDAQDARPWEVGRTAKAIGRGLWETGKSGVRAVAGAAAGEAKLAWAFAKDMLENNMEVRDSTLAAAAKIAGESVASIDEGILQARDLATLVSRTAGRVYRAAPVPGVPGVPGEVTGQRAKVEENPEARRLRLREDLDADAESFRRHTNVAQGGGVVSSLAGVTPERLQAAGVTLDPEAIADKSLFNGPMTFIPMGGGKLFEVIGLGGKTIGIATEVSLAKLFKGAGWAAEKVAAPVVGWVGKEAPLGGAVTAGPGGWVAGKVAHAVTKGTEWGLKRGGAALAENALPIAKLATPAVAGTIEGGLASAPFALGAHTDTEAGQLIGTMAFFGGFGGATRQAVSAAHEGVARAYQARYQEVARDPVRSPAFNIEPNLDQAHTQAIEALRRNDSPTAGLINRVREYFRGKAELYLLPVDQFAQDPRVLAEVQREHPDFTPEQLIAEARGQRGFTVRLDPTEGRGPRKVMLLNGGDAAVYHEPGHVLDWLLRETDRPAWEKYRADLATHVNPIRPALEELYGGKGATGNILDEASAETLGAILRGRSLNGAPPGVLNSAFTALGSLFEKAGIVRPTLDPKTFITGRHGGLTPSFTGRQLAEPVFRSLETPVLAERLKALEIQPVLRPAPGVPGAVPIRAATPGAQAPLMRPPGVGTKEFIAQAKDIEGLSEARRRTQASPLYDANAKAVMDQVWELLQRERGDVTLDYARPETVGENVARYIRRAERLEVELQRKADGTYPVELLQTFRHQAILYGVKVRGDNVNLLSMNLDILPANALRIGEFSARKKAPGLVPYETGSDGHFTEPGFRDFAADVTSYLRNHAHGYGGDGTAMHPPAGWQGVIPAPDPNWKPTLLDPRKAQFINASTGLAPPKTGRVAQRTGPSGMPMPAGMAAQILAEAHGRPLTPAKGAPVFKKEALAKKGIIVPEDVPVMETNPLRAELVDAGFDAKGQLHEVTQELSLEQIRGLTPRPESLLRMPSTDLARAGFMPKRDVTLVGPNGERVAATHDGDQDASVLGLGMVRQITPKESFPGAFTARSTTYEPSLNKKGWTVEDAPATTEPLGPTPQRPIDIPDGMVGSSETNPDRPALPGESAGLTPAAFMSKARGSEITEPADTYGHAVERGKGNLWVRQSGASDNSNRVLLMQFTKDMMYAPTDVNKPPNPLDVAASAYYDKLYAQRKGYARLPDFWEVPQWHAVLTHALGEAADLYVVRDMAEAKSFLATAGYKDVAFSVLDVNKSKVAELADANPGHTVLGGYTDTSEITSRNPRATRYESIDEYVRSLGLEYKRGFDYRLYRGSSVVPRLDLSQGCRHACKFCTITKKVVGTPPEVVTQQVDAFGDLNAPLAYLNDKTLGQHDSYLRLPELYAKMKAANPDFGGFVIQTTAAQMKSFSDEFLRKSGIKFIELGVESYNDSVLKGQRKPANEKLIDAATEQMRRLGIAFIPNIVIGLPGETAATYAHTMDFLRKNSDVISHANIYNLAVYEGSELSKELKTTSAADVDENVLAKSFHTDPAIHENFAREIYDWASQQLDKTPGKPAGEFMAKRKESEDKLLTTYARRLHRAAWREYGDTEKWKETGYLLPDGTQLDFTGKGPDAPPGDYKRTIDHSSIAEAVGENMLTPFIAAASKKAGAGKLGYSGETSGLTAFVNSGAIRIMPELPGAEISSNKEPSEAQYRKLESFFADPSLKNEWGEVAVDLVDQNGYARDSRVYPAVTNPTVIINDIKEFYRAGHLPSRTSSRVAQFHGAFMPQAFEKSKEVADELAKVREGTSSGQTFTGAGKVWDRKDQKVDIVTVASENVLTKALTPAAVQKVADRYEDVLAIPGTAMGVFQMDDPTQTSIDVNALPDQKHRDNTIAFGKFNQQQAIYDPVPTEKDPYGHSIPVGGTGKTVLTSPAQIAKAVQALLKGENAIPAELPKPPEAAMMAKRGRREEPEKLETSGWIDPDGKFRSIQGSMHEDWLARNSAKLNAEYGTDFANVPDIAEREKAIREGFIRVRYEPRTGTLAIEASENAWTTDAKDKIFQLVRENLDDIDHMRVNILNGKMKIVDGGAANLVEYEGIDKLDHLPLISDTGAQRAAFMPKPKKGDAEQAEFGAEVTETDPQAFAREYARRVTQERVEFHPESVPVLFKRTPEGEYIINAKGKPLVNMVKYTFDDSPLSRQAAKGIRGESARQDAQTTAFAKKIAEEARAIADPDVLAGKSWYQETVRLIKEHFKTDAEVTSFAQLLAATSARTDVAQNFKYALEAYNLWKEGKFDDAIASYKKAYAKLETGGLLRQWQRENNSTIVPSDAALKEWWIESRELSLVRENEKQFGQNSDQVLRVLSGTWAEEVRGLKTQQFAKNLAGTDHGATIDVWASRTMKRLGWDGLTKSPWRLLPRSEGGITDPAFLFAQEAFAKAAKELHMQPDDLQALMWFQEKKLWGERGWTRGAGEELASFEEPLKKLQRNEETGRLEIRAAPTEQPLDLGLDLGDINSANFMPKRASQNEKMMSQGMPDAELQRLVTDDRFRRVDKNWHRVLVDEWERRQRLAGAVKPATQSAEKAEIRPK